MGITLASFALVQGSLSESLETKYQIGSGPNDWWLAYPDGSSTASTTMEHPSWVLDALEFNPVVIYVHKGCSYCAPQTEALTKIESEMGDKFAYFNISADGTDARSEEALQAYDPNGGVMYVPLTVIVTLAPNSEGKVEPVWHSTEVVTGEDWIKNYIEDAVSQYDENSANWNK
jgi:glutaredoxin